MLRVSRANCCPPWTNWEPGQEASTWSGYDDHVIIMVNLIIIFGITNIMIFHLSLKAASKELGTEED